MSRRFFHVSFHSNDSRYTSDIPSWAKTKITFQDIAMGKTVKCTFTLYSAV